MREEDDDVLREEDDDVEAEEDDDVEDPNYAIGTNNNKEYREISRRSSLVLPLRHCTRRGK